MRFLRRPKTQPERSAVTLVERSIGPTLAPSTKLKLGLPIDGTGPEAAGLGLRIAAGELGPDYARRPRRIEHRHHLMIITIGHRGGDDGGAVELSGSPAAFEAEGADDGDLAGVPRVKVTVALVCASARQIFADPGIEQVARRQHRRFRGHGEDPPHREGWSSSIVRSASQPHSVRSAWKVFGSKSTATMRNSAPCSRSKRGKRRKRRLTSMPSLMS